MVEGADCLVLIGVAAEELGALRIHVGDEDQGEVLRPALFEVGGAVLCHEGGVRDGGTGCQHLRAADHDAIVSLLNEVDEDVGDLVNRLLAVHRRIDQDMVEEERAGGELLVPIERMLIERRVELRVGSKARHERRLILRRPPHEAVAKPRPCSNGIPRLEQFLWRLAGCEELVRADAVVVDGRQEVALRGVVERVIQAHDGAGGIAESGVSRHILDALAIDVDLACIAQTVEILRAGHQIVDLSS